MTDLEKRTKVKRKKESGDSEKTIPAKKLKTGAPQKSSKKIKPSKKLETGAQKKSSKKIKPAKKLETGVRGKSSKTVKPGLKSKFQNKAAKPLPKDTAKTRKERKLFRKKQKPNYEISYKAKKIWEKLRIQKSELSKEEKSKLVEELLNLVKEQDKQLINLCYAHDTSRVLQTCLKQGNRKQRHQVFEMFKEHIVSMCKNEYAKNIVWKMLKYGISEEREVIMSYFKDTAYRMLRKPRSASVIEYAYNNYATASQRDVIVRQLYGNVFKSCDNADSLSLPQILEKEVDRKSALLSSFKHSLEPFLDKGVIKHTVIHKAFYDFFQCCDDEKIRTELIEGARESLIHMMHTHDGAHVTMQCLWYGTKKDRKVIVKTMKEFVLKLSCEEFGHLPILAAFDCVDDTVFVKKALVQPLLKSIDDLANNKYGKKVLLYLLSPRDPSHFLPETVKLLSSGDNNSSSKKPMDVRHRELTEAASPAVIEYVCERIEDLIFDHSLFVLIETAFLRCYGDKSRIINALVNLLTAEYTPNQKDENDHMHVVEDPCGHMVIKRLIAAESKVKKKNDTADSKFSRAVLNEVDNEALASWSACNRGTQILFALIESEDNEISEKCKAILNKFKAVLKKNRSVKSTKILLKKLG